MFRSDFPGGNRVVDSRLLASGQYVLRQRYVDWERLRGRDGDPEVTQLLGKDDRDLTLPRLEVDVPETGDHEDLGLGRSPLEHPAHLQASTVGKEEIEDDHVGLCLSGQREGGGPVRRLQHPDGIRLRPQRYSRPPNRRSTLASPET